MTSTPRLRSPGEWEKSSSDHFLWIYLVTWGSPHTEIISLSPEWYSEAGLDQSLAAWSLGRWNMNMGGKQRNKTKPEFQSLPRKPGLVRRSERRQLSSLKTFLAPKCQWTHCIWTKARILQVFWNLSLSPLAERIRKMLEKCGPHANCLSDNLDSAKE